MTFETEGSIGFEGELREMERSAAPFNLARANALERRVHGKKVAGKLLQRQRERERAELFDEGPAGNSSTIGSDLFRDFLQTCHQRNDKWRLRPLLPAFDYPVLPFSHLRSFSLPLSFPLFASMPFFRGGSSRMPRLPEKIDYRSTERVHKVSLLGSMVRPAHQMRRAQGCS